MIHPPVPEEKEDHIQEIDLHMRKREETRRKKREMVIVRVKKKKIRESQAHQREVRDRDQSDQEIDQEKDRMMKRSKFYTNLCFVYYFILYLIRWSL